MVTVVEPSRPTAHQHPPAHPVQVQPLWFLPDVHKPSCSARLRTRGVVLDLQSFVILRPCLQLHLDKTCLDIFVLPSQAQLIKVPFPPPFSIQCKTIPAKLTKREALMEVDSCLWESDTGGHQTRSKTLGLDGVFQKKPCANTQNPPETC